MTRRDPEALIRAYLDEGIGQLPDRVIDAIASDVHVTRQRARSGPWRFFAMSRLAIDVAVAVIAVAVAGTAWLGLSRPTSSVGGQSPAPSVLAVAPSTAPSVAPSPSSGSGDLALGSPFPVQPDVITAGGTYQSNGFSAPLAFTMQAYPTQAGSAYNAETWSDGHTLRVWWADGNAVTLHQGIRISNDVCHPTSLIDVPATPAAVGQWLHATNGITVTDAPDVPLPSGVTAKAFDVALGGSCFSGSEGPPGSPPIWFSSNEVHRVYAVQDGDRTILVITWPGSVAPDSMNAATNKLVESLRFP